MPFYTGIAICILAGGVFMEATLSGKKGLKWENPFAKVQWSKPLYPLATLVIYALVLNTLGFILSTAFLVDFLLRGIYPQKWFLVILGATLRGTGTLGTFFLSEPAILGADRLI